jgi:hypothetical protein
VARQVWRAFCRPGVSFIALRRDRGIICLGGREFIPVHKFGKKPAAQCRGINYPGARICLGTKSFITCRCAYPDLRLKTDPGRWLIISKKHDKQLTFIVRVSGWQYYSIVNLNIFSDPKEYIILCLAYKHRSLNSCCPYSNVVQV